MRLLRPCPLRDGDSVVTTQAIAILAAVPGLTPREEREILRALVDVARGRIGDPRLAAPALARAAGRRAGTQIGIWARQELLRIRSEARDSSEGRLADPPEGRAGPDVPDA